MDASRKLQILLADDCRLTRTVVREQLRACGYGVSLASNGQDALEMLNKERFDLVVTDVRMPKVSGEQLLTCMQVHDRLRSIPVVVMSSNSSAEDAAQLMKAGAVEYIVKPVDRSRLLALSRHVRPSASHADVSSVEADSANKTVAVQSTALHVRALSADSQDNKPIEGGRPLISQALLNVIDSLQESPTHSEAAPGGESADEGARAPWAAPGVASSAAASGNGAPLSSSHGQQPAERGPGKNGRPAQHIGQVQLSAAPSLQLYSAGTSPPATITYPVFFAAPSLAWNRPAHPSMFHPGIVAVGLSPTSTAQPTATSSTPSSSALARKLALERFRRKKANRDYTKKVRYEARKKLAEQRPRFKGQFVKLPSQQQAAA